MERYIDYLKNLTFQKKIILWGAGIFGINLAHLLKKNGREIAYFVDMDEAKWNTNCMGVDIRNPYDILYENMDETIVLITAVSYVADIVQTLLGMGLVENIHFFIAIEHRDEEYDYVDYFLGYSRKRKFYVHGDENSDIKIVALGGSTTDYSQYGIPSWPHYLSMLINEKKGVTPCIYNGGVAGYLSSQEMLKCIRDVFDLKPLMVISYSGINDAFEGKKENTLVNDYLDKTWKMLCRNKDIEITAGNCIERESVDRWIFNMKTMHGICSEFHVQFYSFLQPMMVSGRYVLNDDDLFYLRQETVKQRMQMTKAFYNAAVEKIGDIDFIHNFSGIFDGMDNIYLDYCHCNEKGNKIIASAIYRCIESELTKWI